MTQASEDALERLETGVPNLDAILHGGLPRNSAVVLAGPPGSGKTILTQQMCFHHASRGGRVLYFNTLSISTAKTLLYLRPFAFFDPALFDERVRFVDLGQTLRSQGIERACDLLMEHIKQFKPSLVVVDSFKVFDDLAGSAETLRKFAYELSVRLMAWECTSLLLGEYAPEELTHPAYSAIDGIITVKQRDVSGEQRRLIQVVKLRGTPHDRNEHPFRISRAGVEIFAPSVTLPRRDTGFQPPKDELAPRCRTGVSRMDEMLGDGIPWGSSVLLSGPAGSGKTVLGLEFLYRGARELGQKGICFSFAESESRLLATARGLGWPLERELERGMVEIVVVNQPDILVEADLLMMHQRIEALGARRVFLDSLSVFLYRINEARVVREKLFHLAGMMQSSGAVGLFASSTPVGGAQISRFGVEETMVDGVILLYSEEASLDRQRSVEIYKMRNTDHVRGRHAMTIALDGLRIYPRVDQELDTARLAPTAMGSERGSTGVAGLDALVGGGVLRGSVTLVAGSPGTGKSTLGIHFVLEAARRRQRSLYLSMAEGPEQLVKSAEGLGLPLREAVKDGWVDILYVHRDGLHVARFLSALLDPLKAGEVARLVLDGTSEAEHPPAVSEQLGAMMPVLVGRLRELGVTSLFTLEARDALPSGWLGDGGLSTVADNLIVLRYREEGQRLVPTLTVMKVRGSAHDRGIHAFELGPGGLSLRGVPAGTQPPPKVSRRPSRPPTGKPGRKKKT
ncbi:MAG TPA: ATPase domain-containing protein [Myxococcaceae bacterium]|nr:ATPase domain-containing protein [Myxococcaceae bacterium]